MNEHAARSTQARLAALLVTSLAAVSSCSQPRAEGPRAQEVTSPQREAIYNASQDSDDPWSNAVVFLQSHGYPSGWCTGILVTSPCSPGPLRRRIDSTPSFFETAGKRSFPSVEHLAREWSLSDLPSQRRG
jgi:hypothetical protein